MYRSAFWEIGVLALVAAVVVALFTLPQNFGFGLLSHSGPLPLSTVMLDKFAPKEMVHLGDTIMAALLSLFLLSNAARMFVGLDPRSADSGCAFISRRSASLIVQGVTQMRWKNCNDRDASKNWLRHLFLVSGYATIFTLVVCFCRGSRSKNSSFHWTSILGYYSTVVLLVTTAWMMLDRIGKRTEMHRFSHLSDWLFPDTAFSHGVDRHSACNMFRLSNLPMPTYVTYIVHMAIAVPMLVVEVPFGKWSHLLYRPLAIYVATVKKTGAGIRGRGAAVAARRPLRVKAGFKQVPARMVRAGKVHAGCCRTVLPLRRLPPVAVVETSCWCMPLLYRSAVGMKESRHETVHIKENL